MSNKMNDPILIREAQAIDITAITDLSIQLGYKISIEQTEEYLRRIQHNSADIVYVAVINNNVVGWIQLFNTTRLESGSFCEIVGLVVDEQFRGQGIGNRLIEEGKTWAISRNITKLRVRCNTKRLDTHKFYRNIGFSEVKEQKVFETDLT